MERSEVALVHYCSLVAIRFLCPPLSKTTLVLGIPPRQLVYLHSAHPLPSLIRHFSLRGSLTPWGI